MNLLRRVALLGAGLLLAVLAIRVAAVLAFASDQPAKAQAVWPDHPAAVLSAGLAEIGATVASGRAPAPGLTARLGAVAQRDPLNPGPLLVVGTNAFAAGDLPRAEQLLQAASRLDPLSPAPRFLLADLYFRQGRSGPGLAQVGFLFDRLNGGAAPLVPALAQFAAQPGGAARLKLLVARQPQVRDQLLSLLAADPANLPAIMTLAPPSSAGTPAPAWQEQLLSAMVAKQDYQGAYRLWRRLAGLPGEGSTPGLFNPRVVAGGPPPPFNWRLTSGSPGLAEPQNGGGMHLLYFGREEAVLADQVLLLPPGRYRLSYKAGGVSTGLSWGLTCLPGTDRQEGPLDRNQFDFVVPASGCPAQRLEIRGTLGDMPVTADVTVTSLALSRGGAT